MTYDIYRNTTLIATVNPTGTQTKQIMGANTVVMTFTFPAQTEFKVGDYMGNTISFTKTNYISTFNK